MSKLKLSDIKKSYHSGEVVHALKGVSLEFRESEFVSILGPSGCGKTTLLNIIGGLDRYDEGDLSLGGKSTRRFKDRDWDAYRNRSIGFVFQNYNLISHQTILQNVEIAMTLSGVSATERREKAKQALTSVGLADKLNQRPNQLSGGQMQRVAIARALVNDPDIILADEPTGALDSQTSLQVMEILKDISADKLVIMVTHNADLAEAYSSRIIHLRDGEVQSDSHPLANEETVVSGQGSDGDGELHVGKTSMSLMTALSLSFRNLLTKKGRTLITSFAGSIGIIGVALVLALSNGLSTYIGNVQSDTLAGFPVTVSEGVQFMQGPPEPPPGSPFAENGSEGEEFPTDNLLRPHERSVDPGMHVNQLTEEYFDHVAELTQLYPNSTNAVTYSRDVEMNLLARGGADVVKFETSTSMPMELPPGFGETPTYWQELPEDDSFILSMYDLIGEGSRYPAEAGEIALVVNSYNQLDQSFFEKLGMAPGGEALPLEDWIDKTVMKLVPNDSFYTAQENGLFTPAGPDAYTSLFDGDEGTTLTITGILRIKEDAASSSGFLSEGLAYTPQLAEAVVENAEASEIAAAQLASDRDVVSNVPFADDAAKQQRLRMLGADTTPTSISIYPANFAGKDVIKQHLDAYNTGREEGERILYTDMSEMIGTAIQTALDTVSYVLIGFAAISLVVSTIMIGIITYVSVLERTKEIGILRSIGARKKDISRLFNAETLIVGLVAGSLGIGIAYVLSLVISRIIAGIVEIEGIAQLTAVHALSLVAGSMLLTLIAGLIPARAATKKDPVIALRTE
ncbi:ATP-binding cassette domain-containing protein [Paenibacillus daejeonensis]|uniref:ABC transporter ATP-binding protein/permease n=1 Tax=Paenibacillus daejeonensis TaxID=135193 RepID=UPI00039C384E|nr:ABC transporter ATP-binding protein/permease [Paenibacillus daejeonensis]